MGSSAFDERSQFLVYGEINGDDGPGANTLIDASQVGAARLDIMLAMSDDTIDQPIVVLYVDVFGNARQTVTVTVPHGATLTSAMVDLVPRIRVAPQDAVLLPHGWRLRLLTVGGITAGKRIWVLAWGGTL